MAKGKKNEKSFFNDLTALFIKHGIKAESMEDKNYSSRIIVSLGSPKAKLDLADGGQVQGSVSLYYYSPETVTAVSAKKVERTMDKSTKARETLNQCIKDLVSSGMDEIQARAFVFGGSGA